MAPKSLRAWYRRKTWLLRLWLRTRWDQLRAPWPIVGECHSRYVEGHYCEQCAPRHKHEWAAWPEAPSRVASGGGIPVRCVHCGGRKCDFDDCNELRHDHTHQDGMALPIIVERKRPPLPSERRYA
jgi:hypothetical protein